MANACLSSYQSHTTSYLKTSSWRLFSALRYFIYDYNLSFTANGDISVQLINRSSIFSVLVLWSDDSSFSEPKLVARNTLQVACLLCVIDNWINIYLWSLSSSSSSSSSSVSLPKCSSQLWKLSAFPNHPLMLSNVFLSRAMAQRLWIRFLTPEDRVEF